MLTDKRFWFGFMIAYAIAIFLPPRRLFGRREG